MPYQHENGVDVEAKHKFKSHDFNQLALKQQFPVGEDYELNKLVGKGSYGTVCRARHIPSDTPVAIKKVSNVFNHVGDAKRLLREV